MKLERRETSLFSQISYLSPDEGPLLEMSRSFFSYLLDSV